MRADPQTTTTAKQWLRRVPLRVPIHAVLASFLVSLVPLATIVLVLLHMQAVWGTSPLESAVMLLPLLGGMLASMVACRRFVTRPAIYKPLAIASGLVLIAGVLTLSAIGPQSAQVHLAWRLALTGTAAGAALRMFGLMQQGGNLALDSARVVVPPAQLKPRLCTGLLMGLLGRVGPSSPKPTRVTWITQLAGAVLGIGLFAAAFTHSLAPELARHVPLLPGEREHVDVQQAQTEAMNLAAIRARVDSALDQRLLVVERAYGGDQAAAEEILADVRLPEAMKAALRDGGIRARVHRYLTERAWHIEAELQAGENGRDELLSDPLLPAGLKRQIANVPMRAFRDEDSSARVASLFREAILAREDDVVAAATQHSWLSVRAVASAHADELVERVREGLKNAFAAAIAQSFASAAWIVALAVLIVAFTPNPYPARAAN